MNDDAFDYIGGIAEDLAAMPADLLAKLAELRRAASAHDVAALRHALRTLETACGEIAFAVSAVAMISGEIAPELRVA